MASSERAEGLATDVAEARLGDVERRAKEIGKDHDPALELRATGAFSARLLSVLVLDTMRLSQDVNLALHEDEVVAKYCVPSYLPELITIEVAMRER